MNVYELPLLRDSAVDQLAGVLTEEGPPVVDWDRLIELFWEDCYDAHWGTRRVARRDVQLSKTAWELLKRVIDETPLPITLTNTSFGFTVGIAIWTEAEEPFPGAFVQSKALFILDPHFLPGCPQQSFDYAWNALSPLVRRPKNIELLKQSKLELPRAKGDYAY